MESIVGKILCDRYRVIRQLSGDDFSSVLIAEDLDRPDKLQCQIERLQPHYEHEVLGAQSWQRVLKGFVAQGNILKNISQHPQIPQLLAFFECDREFYLVREFIDGESLEQKLIKSSIDETEAINWLQEILGILDFVHQADIIHLNIQPSSLIQHQNGQKFLSNFGNIKNTVLFNKKLFETIANDDFSALELKEGKPDPTTDIYALGKTIIYALTGKVAEKIAAKSLYLIPEENPSYGNDIPIADIRPELADILNKMVGKRSEIRYQSAAEVLEELDFSQKSVTLPPPMFNNFNPPRDVAGYTSKSPRSGEKNRISKFKQKIIWLFLTLPFILALGIIFVGVNRNVYKDFRTYINDNYQFEIKYPQAWSYRELDDPITGEVVVFSSPLETDSDLFLERVNITVEYLSSEPITLEQYTQTVFERIRQAKGSEIQIHQDSKARMAESPARRVVYSREENGLQLRQMETFMFKNNQVYIAIYTAERSKFSKFLDSAEKIIDSWKIQ
ncbi:protein kinase [Waterburya agarophytonicola K14]|uniref:non-specific serine/threonine protein kinase n=1 Tax=Waterburya agarophytonicola KI4 TaxID=2874699 RepID=A0A964BM75_9CYAN|nr:PsbP-related protein [Waterburya agarophytonicola]MCC0175689.1 protein kinase [Waterburya agarophytonicola KI4]